MQAAVVTDVLKSMSAAGPELGECPSALASSPKFLFALIGNAMASTGVSRSGRGDVDRRHRA